VTKTDTIQQLERDHSYTDEHFDFIQYNVRQFCLQYGAALFYTSVKEDKNCDLLYKYLVHRIYGLEFRTPALIVEKEAVFIPSGWDNEKKMAILHESMLSFKPDAFYNEVIQRPVTRKPTTLSAEIEVEDEQSYLERQLLTIQQQTLNPRGANLTPSPHGKGGQVRGQSVSPLTPGSAGGNKKPGDSNPSDRVLANFFNSLLSRKSAGSPKAGGDDRDPSRSEVAEELDSLLSKKKMDSSPANPAAQASSLNSSEC